MAEEIAYFGAGCFWGVEHTFQQQAGVRTAVSGYMGGHLDNPTYEQVCAGTTGHAEVVEVTYDDDQVSYGQLLNLFWKMHDPTTPNRQGPDVGTQYRSIILTTNPQQALEAKASKDKLDSTAAFPNPIVTDIVPAGAFYPAEEYHQDYFVKHPGRVQCHFIN